MTRIRSARAGDAPAIREIYAPSVAGSPTSFEAEVPDVGELAARIAKIQEQLPWLVLEEDGAVLGYAYAAPHRARHAYQWCVEVSVYVAAGARRRGVGRRLYAVLFEVLRRQGYVNAYAGVTLPNPASVALHTAVGFTPVGVYRRIGWKLGAWHDVGWYELRLAEPAAPVETLAPASAVLAGLL